MPKSKGGNNTPLNKRKCCGRCNTQRGSKPLINWLVELKKQYLKIESWNKKKYILQAQIENVEYWIEYIKKQGSLLYKSQLDFKKYKDDYSYSLDLSFINIVGSLLASRPVS